MKKFDKKMLERGIFYLVLFVLFGIAGAISGIQMFVSLEGGLLAFVILYEYKLENKQK